MKRNPSMRALPAAIVAALALLALAVTPAYAVGWLPLVACEDGFTITLSPVVPSQDLVVTSISPAGDMISVHANPGESGKNSGLWASKQAVGTPVTIWYDYYQNGVFQSIGLLSGSVEECKKPVVDDDDRINHLHGDDWAALYVRADDQGSPDIQVWCINLEGEGYFGMQVTQADIDAAVPHMPPAANTLVKRTLGCLVPVSFYVLTTGEYQVNIGQDWLGKLFIVYFTGLPPTDLHFAIIDP